MDNITHSLIGATVAELTHHALPPVSGRDEAETVDLTQKRRRLLYLVSIMANNFPDLDLLYDRLLIAKPLGYLLHHRGHTHTIAGFLPQLALILLFLYCFRGRFGFSSLGRREWQQASLLGLFGLCLHVFADSFNSYGVHPFFPFDSRWYYGDSVFILEPVIWSTLGAGLVWNARRTWWKWFAPAFLVVIPFVFFWNGFLHRFSIIGLTFWTVLLMVGLRFFRPIHRVAMAVVLVLLWVANQFLIGQSVKAELKSFIEASAEKPIVADISLTPLAVNPLCWTALSVERTHSEYISRRAIYSKWPEVIAPSDCPQLRGRSGLEVFSPQFENSPHVVWIEEFRMPLPDFQKMAFNCFSNAWLRFVRVPHIKGDILNDLRFSGIGGGNFTTLDLAEFETKLCPRFVPNWIHPTALILFAPKG